MNIRALIIVMILGFSSPAYSCLPYPECHNESYSLFIHDLSNAMSGVGSIAAINAISDGVRVEIDGIEYQNYNVHLGCYLAQMYPSLDISYIRHIRTGEVSLCR